MTNVISGFLPESRTFAGRKKLRPTIKNLMKNEAGFTRLGPFAPALPLLFSVLW